MEYHHFCDDADKMRDFNALTRMEFLDLYPQVTKEEYKLTVREHQKRLSDVYHSDRFYVDYYGGITWMWYNANSFCEDTFETLCFEPELIGQALGLYTEVADIYDYILENGRLYGADYGDDAYDSDRRFFENEEPFAVGATKETIEKFIRRFNIRPQHFYCVKLYRNDDQPSLYYTFASTPKDAATRAVQREQLLFDEHYQYPPAGVYSAQYGVFGGNVDFDHNLLK